MMTIPPELIDFIHIANMTCTACVQKVKYGARLDQTALWGLVERIMGLGLDVVHVHLVAPESR
jgi:hypothetical protein